MKLYFKQRFFTWFDSYDIYDENENTLFTVEGQLAWGHCLKIFDAYLGCIQKEFSLFTPRYDIDFNGWHVEGSFLEWDYTIEDGDGKTVATISKELFHWTDTYLIDVADARDALHALMFVLAIDAEKCSRN